MLPIHSYEPPDKWSRLGIFGCRLAASLVVLVTPALRLVALIVDRLHPKYAPGMVAVSIDRLLDQKRDQQRHFELKGWSSPIVWTPSWMLGVRPVWGRGARDSYELDERYGITGPVIERGIYWFMIVDVTPGTEWSAILLIRLDAIAALRFGSALGWLPVQSSILACRWPRFELSSPELSPGISVRAREMLAASAARAGSGRPRVATVDTAFDGPPHVKVMSSKHPDALSSPPSALHGAVVCSLISGSCPSAEIEHYPVLMPNRKVDSAVVYEALGAIGAGKYVDVVNLSLSVTAYHYPEATVILFGYLVETIRRQHPKNGTVFVAANGNKKGGGRITLPARLAQTLGVGCVEADGKPWPESRGGDKDGESPNSWLVAQGIGIIEGREGGTSFSAALVTGLVAVLVSQGLEPDVAASRLLSTADKSFDFYDPKTHGLGIARLMGEPSRNGSDCTVAW